MRNKNKKLKIVLLSFLLGLFLFCGPIGRISGVKTIKVPEVKAQLNPYMFDESRYQTEEEKKEAAQRAAQRKAEKAERPGAFQRALIWAIGGLFYIILKLVSLLLALAGEALDIALKFDKFLEVEGVKQGWRLVRDLCNMFFVLILLIIGFATIFRIESYGAKRLLVKLIIAAILVNFSFLISGLIIDFSQVMMKSFVNAIREKSWSAAVVQIAGIPHQYGEKEAVISYAAFYNYNKKEINWGMIMNIIKTIVIVTVMFFVLIAIAIILIIRVIALWILVILSPFAYVLAVLPNTADLANKWWQSFLKYCFIGPVMAFFMILALRIGSKSQDFINQYANTAAGGGYGADLTPAPLIGLENGIKLLQFIMVILLLISGAMSAMWLSIVTPGKIISGAKGFAKTYAPAGKLVGWAGKRGAGALAGVGALAGAAASRIPGMRRVGATLGRPFEKRKVRRRATKQEKAEKKWGAMYDAFGKEQVMHGAERAVRPYERAVAIQRALKKGYLRDADPKTVRKMAQTLDKLGYHEDLAKLYEQRPGLAPDKESRIKAVAAAIRSGEYKKFTPEALSDNPEAAKELMNQLGPVEGKKYYDALNAAQQDVIKKTYIPNPDEPVFDEDRKIYAKLTGNIEEAFRSVSPAHPITTDKIVPAARGAGSPEEVYQAYVPTLSGEDITKIKGDASYEIIGKYASQAQLENATRTGKLSQEARNAIRRGARERADIIDYMDNSPLW